MTLYHILGIINSGRSFSVAFCFLSQEKKKQKYDLDLTQLQEIFEDKEPSLIVTDKEQALIRSIESVFPSSHHLLCVWQILKNIQTHFRKHFKSEDEWKLFQKQFHRFGLFKI